MKRFVTLGGSVLAIIMIVIFFVNRSNEADDNRITAMVESGDVATIVSVSGFIEAKNTATLAFPTNGIVTDVFISEGAKVIAGDVLATQAANELVARRSKAVATLARSNAAYQEARAGASETTRQVAATAVQNAENNLIQVMASETEKVENAYRTLLSTDLEARTANGDESATPPVITGTYTCDVEGVYTIDVYRSGTNSGYSYTGSGLESFSDSVFTNQPSPLGNCGLYIQFQTDTPYANSIWEIEVPNTRSTNYTTNNNSYSLALQQQTNAVAAATDAVTLAKTEAAATNAQTRTEVVAQRTAAIDEATAQIAEIDAAIADRSIVAPFDGEIIEVDILPGETAGASPVITLLAADAFELTARIPEIDINKLTLGQKATVVFDAQNDTELTGTITYLSPLATEIDGVAYFETTITLDNQPSWIRSGLNADINIVVAEQKDVSRIPRRFVTENIDGTYTLLTRDGDRVASTTVDVQFIGNDGYVQIAGIPIGTEVIAP